MDVSTNYRVHPLESPFFNPLRNVKLPDGNFLLLHDLAILRRDYTQGRRSIKTRRKLVAKKRKSYFHIQKYIWAKKMPEDISKAKYKTIDILKT